LPTQHVDSDIAAVEHALGRYRAAYEDLDVDRVSGVWPGVNKKALSRAFAGLESQTLVFDSCAIGVDGNRATARCKGMTVYVPRVGTRAGFDRAMEWHFDLRKSDSGWSIERSSVR
jgi:hypothetical protein